MDPLDSKAPSDPADDSRALPEVEARRGRTILIVENDGPSRLLIEQILAFSGYASRAAANGREAMALLEETRFDLILMDLTMPVLDGYQTLELVRKRPDYPATPIVAVSGHAGDEEREQARRRGFTAYLTKPFRPAELIQLIDRLLLGETDHMGRSDEQTD